MLKVLEFDVVVHPQLPNGVSTKPDFLASNKTGSFYVEAKVVYEKSEHERNTRKVLNYMIDDINKANIKDCFIVLKRATLLSGRQPSSNTIKKCIIKKLISLNLGSEGSEAKVKENGGFDGIPFTYEDEDIKLKLEVIPYKNYHEADSRPIGVISFGADWSTTIDDVRKAIREKGRKYGELDKPLVIALNCFGIWDVVDEKVLEILFGRIAYHVDVESEKATPFIKNDGVWAKSGNHKTQKVSSILMCYIFPSNVGKRKYCHYINPWADNKMNGFLDSLQKCVLKDNSLKYIKDDSSGNPFGLPNNWPNV